MYHPHLRQLTPGTEISVTGTALAARGNPLLALANGIGRDCQFISVDDDIHRVTLLRCVQAYEEQSTIKKCKSPT